jgi:hypothetical protein
MKLFFYLYNYAIQNNLVSESYDATWNCPTVKQKVYLIKMSRQFLNILTNQRQMEVNIIVIIYIVMEKLWFAYIL